MSVKNKTNVFTFGFLSNFHFIGIISYFNNPRLTLAYQLEIAYNWYYSKVFTINLNMRSTYLLRLVKKYNASLTRIPAAAGTRINRDFEWLTTLS